MIRTLIGSLALFACAAAALSQEPAAITMGNGQSNAIVTDDVTRDGGALTFQSVTIEKPGWLVVHPFEEGKPNGDKSVGATYIPQGESQDVELEVYKGLEAGEPFLVMLHFDSNDNQIFDFVFITDTTLMDLPVFEGSTMIGHVVTAP